jgi:hypothetical protein
MFKGYGRTWYVGLSGMIGRDLLLVGSSQGTTLSPSLLMGGRQMMKSTSSWKKLPPSQKAPSLTPRRPPKILLLVTLKTAVLPTEVIMLLPLALPHPTKK